eukprot:3669557-Heterocapsa_arctica.AAC.1
MCSGRRPAETSCRMPGQNSKLVVFVAECFDEEDIVAVSIGRTEETVLEDLSDGLGEVGPGMDRAGCLEWRCT